MRRDPRAFVWDMRDACSLALGFVREVSLEDYLADRLMQSAVERQLQNMGEAMSQRSRADPALAARVPDRRRLIAFRNLLVHGYAVVKQEELWRLLQTNAPQLQESLASLLTELGAPPESSA